MAPHLTADELDFIAELKGKGLTPIEMHKKFVAHRKKTKQVAPTLAPFRKILKGATYKRGKRETRGSKRKLTPTQCRKIFMKRKELIQKFKGEKEISWPWILKACRVKVDPTTAVRSLQANGYNVEARKPREKPMRTEEAIEERWETCGKWRKYAATYWTELNLIHDVKRFPVPTYEQARRAKSKLKVRFVLRTRGEGLAPGFTKPHARKHKVNPGGSVLVAAGIVKNKVRMWEYLDGWGAEKAASLYRGPVKKCLKRNFPGKASFRVLEDNDPSGYKTKAAKAAKKEIGVKSLPFPRYSPDLNPCDYFLWDEVERRMEKSKPKKPETMAAYKARLKRVAMSIPPSVIKKGVMSMKKRCQMCWGNNGNDIPRD